MHSSSQSGLSLVDQESVPGEVDEELDEVHQRVAVSEELIAKLQGELEGVADQEAEIAQRLDSDRKRRAALDRQLHKAREEAASLMLDEAFGSLLPCMPPVSPTRHPIASTNNRINQQTPSPLPSTGRLPNDQAPPGPPPQQDVLRS